MLRAMNSGNVASGGAAASSSSGSRSGQAASTDFPPGFRPQAKPVPVKATPKRPDAPPAKAFLPPSPLNYQSIIASPCSPSSQDTLPTSNSDIMVDESPQMAGAGATSKASAPLPATTWAAPFPPMPPAQPMPAASAAPWDASTTRWSITKWLQPCEFGANATSFSSTAPGDVTKKL